MKKLMFLQSTFMIICLCGSSVAIGQEFSQAAIAALGNAFIRANPIYAFFYGSLEDYVAENPEFFVAEGEAIRCARDLSQALLRGAIQSYDPDALRRRDELNTQLRVLGIEPGSPQATPSEQLYATARQLDRLVYALPSAANGNFQLLHTPRNEIERMQIFAEQLLEELLKDPTVRGVFIQLEPMIRELAELEYKILVEMANNLRRSKATGESILAAR